MSNAPTSRMAHPLFFVAVFAALTAAAFAASAASDLPDGYLRVEWLQSKGTSSVFDTGYVFTNKPLVKTTALIRSTGDGDVAGTAVAQAGCFIVDYFDQQRKVYYRYSTGNSVGLNYAESVYNRWIDFEWGATVKHDGVVVGTVSSYDFSANEQTFRLFGGRTALSCWFKEVWMYDGDELVRHYVPCCERATCKPGFYDTVNGVFGPVDAVAGPFRPIADFSGLAEAKYIESSGSEFIDTGYIFTNAPRLDISYFIVRFDDSDIAGMPSVEPAPCFIVDIYPPGGGKYYYRYGSSSATQIAAGLTAKRWYDCSFGTNVVQDGVTLATLPPVSFASNLQSFKLFAGRSTASVRIRHARMYDGDVLVRDFEPCYCGSFGEYGFHDKVEDRFYPSMGTPFKNTPVKARPSRRAEYLESSKTQLIDTDVIFTNTPLVKARMKFCENADTDVAGTTIQASNCFIVDYASGASGGTLYYRYASAGYTSTRYSGGIGEWHDYEWGPTVRHDGNTILTVTAADGAFASNRCPFTLFGARNNNNNSSVAFSSVQMFENGEMVRDLIPAVYKGEAGMYDQVEGFFYFNVGTGEFETGRVFSDATIILAR